MAAPPVAGGERCCSGWFVAFGTKGTEWSGMCCLLSNTAATVATATALPKQHTEPCTAGEHACGLLWPCALVSHL